MLALRARIVRILMISLTLLNKLRKIWFFQKIFCWLTLAWFFTLSNANIWFAGRELIWMTYTAVNNQADRTLEQRPKRQFVARSRRSRMSPSWSPPSIWITPIFWHQQLSYWSGLPSHSLALWDCSSVITIVFDYASEVSMTWQWRIDTHCLGLRLYYLGQSINSERRSRRLSAVHLSVAG